MASTAPVPLPSSQTNSTHPRQRHRYRGTRGGSSAPRNDQSSTILNIEGTQLEASRNAALSLLPASVAPRSHPSSAEPSDAEHSSTEHNSPRRRGNATGRGRRGGHIASTRTSGALQPGGDTGNMVNSRRGRGVTNRTDGVSSHLTNHGSGKQFGGRLTTASTGTGDSASILASSLQPDAPEFRPGQHHADRPISKRRDNAPNGQQKHPLPLPQRRRQSSIAKSTAPDIATRTHEDISNSVYECPICTSEVARNSKVWSCKTCWTVFHLSCIKKWSQNEGSTLAQQQLPDGDLPPPRQWRCPGCNLPKDVLPTTYFCWCEKDVDPRPVSGIPPHSCGQTCGKPRKMPKKCPHPCDLLCHAGPCPPCSHTGPIQSCFCGKKSTSRRCVDTNYETGWSCGEVCGDLMPCGEHVCRQPCHEGLCGACEVPVDGRCYCGKVSKQVICCERGSEKQSKKASLDEEGRKVVEEWNGNLECSDTCGRDFDCGKHKCEKRCHSQEANAPHCPRSPDVITHCPCGKTLLDEISVKSRQSCDDLIPNCHKECLKKLACGHSCQEVCHSGPCMPCLKTVSINCRCGRTTCSTICHQGSEESPQCMRICHVTLNCGRHECGEHCCPGERRAAERQALKRKLRPLGAAPRFDDGFEAEHICTRLCGRTLKCGNHPCPELCHKGPCGSCREAIFDEISCHCGRTVLQPPLPCGTQPPPCRYQCERPKHCGHPQIPHTCHGNLETCPKCPFLVEKACMCGKKNLKNQPCWLADVRCGEICGRKLRCGSHFCRNLCHRAGECEDAGRACQQLCGKAKKSCGHPCEEPCHAPSSCREEKLCLSKLLITCDCQHLKQELKCNASRNSEGNSKKSLSCDDECARLERNRKLALALNIDPEAHKDDHIPYSAATLQMFRSESTKWCQTQEREFRVFAADEREKRLRFKPMPPIQRSFIHSLSDDFGFDSESMDPEPHRHVLILKTPRFVMAPMKTLAECVRIRNSADEAAATSQAARKNQTSNEPFNGFVLTGPRFGLTLDELRGEFATAFASVATLAFEIGFLPSEEIVLKARPAAASTTIAALSVEALLKTLKPTLISIASTKHLSSAIHLCALDSSLNILRKESDGGDTDGWSQVAAKAAVGARTAPRMSAVGTKSSFTVLGSRLQAAKEKKKKEKEREASVVDDWEEEVRREEELQRPYSDGEGNSSKIVDAREHGIGSVNTISAPNVPVSDHEDARVIDNSHGMEGEVTAGIAVSDTLAVHDDAVHDGIITADTTTTIPSPTSTPASDPIATPTTPTSSLLESKGIVAPLAMKPDPIVAPTGTLNQSTVVQTGDGNVLD